MCAIRQLHVIRYGEYLCVYEKVEKLTESRVAVASIYFLSSLPCAYFYSTLFFLKVSRQSCPEQFFV